MTLISEHARSAAIEKVSIDHCRSNVAVTKEFLHNADVVDGFDQVCGESVPECVGRDSFCNLRATHGGGNCPADC